MLDAMLKRKDRLDFYPCVADTVFHASDHTCDNFVAEIVFVGFIQQLLDAW